MNAASQKFSAKRRFAVTVAGLGLALALPASAYAAPVSIVIDPGHGGKDPGAVSHGLQEKRSNLAISLAVAKEAKRQGWKVSMTRDDDRFIPLNKRPAKANRSRADVFVSIHSNSTGSRKDGTMAIYRSKSGKRLGRAIMSELQPLTPYKDIGNRKDVRGLAVLRGSKRPAVLIEVLSVSTPSERRQLKDPEARAKYAQAIVRGIAKFKHVDYKPIDQPQPELKTEPTPLPPTSVPQTEPVGAPTTAALEPVTSPLKQTGGTPVASQSTTEQLLSRVIGLFR